MSARTRIQVRPIRQYVQISVLSWTLWAPIMLVVSLMLLTDGRWLLAVLNVTVLIGFWLFAVLVFRFVFVFVLELFTLQLLCALQLWTLEALLLLLKEEWQPVSISSTGESIILLSDDILIDIVLCPKRIYRADALVIWSKHFFLSFFCFYLKQSIIYSIIVCSLLN